MIEEKSFIAISAIIFLIDTPTKSVLLFESESEGIGGYVFRDPELDPVIKERAVNDLCENTGVVVNESNPFCVDVIKTATGILKFVVVVKDFRIPTLPKGSKWYHKNQIPFSRIQCKEERSFLRDYMNTL